MSNARTLLRCILGPQLYSFYKVSGHTLSATTPEILQRSHDYRKNPIEAMSDYILRAFRIITSFGTYISPVLISYFAYKRNTPGSYASTLDQSVLLQLLTTVATIFVSSSVLRGLGRYTNPEYTAFLKVLEDARQNPSPSNKRLLVHFDADFSAYPVDFKWSEARDNRPPAPYSKSLPSPPSNQLLLDNSLMRIPIELLCSLIMRTVGKRLVYPGTLGILQTILQPAISQGRTKLVEDHGGVRMKLQSYDGNFVDSMFIDRRGSTPNGDYLVIGCEGNGGFYELGTILTPLEAGYSVLGWNHPGFGGSTGTPYPDQEVAAIDTVVKFALDKLSFAPSQIVLYGWSIGGFAATWAGMMHPNVHGLVIDASFDHLLALAGNMFPSFMYPMVEMAIKKHFDLNNSRHLEHFQGPVLLIRRSQDEVIATDPHNSPPTNRANNLLIDLLKNRFPKLVNVRGVNLLNEYLGGNARYQNGVLRRYSVNNTSCLRLLLEHLHCNPSRYPINIGPELDNTTRDQLVLFLASKHLQDYDSVHCAPLPSLYFQRPWNLIGISINESNL